jgi:hypothetical protein
LHRRAELARVGERGGNAFQDALFGRDAFAGQRIAAPRASSMSRTVGAPRLPVRAAARRSARPVAGSASAVSAMTRAVGSLLSLASRGG